MDSIDRSNGKYDVRFRYLIGKDLVQASVNCDSSLVTPDQGKPFVPDMTGATREMIKLACGERRELVNRYQGYGQTGYQSVPTDPGFSFRGFWVSSEAIDSTNELLSTFRNPLAYRFKSSQIADAVAMYCQARDRGLSDREIVNISTMSVIEMTDADDDIKGRLLQYWVATRTIAKRHVCPQFSN
ncbi:hypothetical protein LBWT_31560 [Leptolyngbya boryana IAM M-101]|nr:hypothetical protein LBWT_31560 [Leptolyngbya boryana IAM M-101]BAS63550.1 hypothetical protein LBDG_31560 [Leptolyngbya boryana dg5]